MNLRFGNRTINRHIRRFKLRFYKNYIIPRLEKKLRKKNEIKVLFVISSLGAWKTESLFQTMLQHPKFAPYVLISDCYDEDDREAIANYCSLKKYPIFIKENDNFKIYDHIIPDIIFYQKPYEGYTPESIRYYHNLKSLFCYINYAFSSSINAAAWHHPYLYNCWQIYYENKTICHQYQNLMKSAIPNGYGIGTPMIDELLSPKKKEIDPWKKTNYPKKRIIYAPHHSFNPDNWWQSSTFLETGELMLEIAEKYSKHVQWAFKPHPVLRGKLEKYWGKQRTDDYYRRWSEVEWSQYESGKYSALFKYSDALIHDCGSFITEYIFTGNPVMYLLRDSSIGSDWNETCRQAFNLHYKGKTRCEIEQFIENVINGTDLLLNDRKDFISNHLQPPYGKTSCQNIIDAILGLQ